MHASTHLLIDYRASASDREIVDSKNEKTAKKCKFLVKSGEDGTKESELANYRLVISRKSYARKERQPAYQVIRQWQSGHQEPSLLTI